MAGPGQRQTCESKQWSVPHGPTLHHVCQPSGGRNARPLSYAAVVQGRCNSRPATRVTHTPDSKRATDTMLAVGVCGFVCVWGGFSRVRAAGLYAALVNTGGPLCLGKVGKGQCRSGGCFQPLQCKQLGRGGRPYPLQHASNLSSCTIAVPLPWLARGCGPYWPID